MEERVKKKREGKEGERGGRKTESTSMEGDRGALKEHRQSGERERAAVDNVRKSGATCARIQGGSLH